MYCFFIIHSIPISSMKPRDIEDRLREAFSNFNLTDPVPTVTTPKESTSLWSYKNNHCDLSPDATTDKDLCTFTAHWLAASIKNRTEQQVQKSFNAAALGTFALFFPSLFVSEASDKLRASTAGLAFILTGLNVPEKVACWVRNECTKESFFLACDRLFETEKYAALVAYFSHLQINSHTPLSYKEKQTLINQAATNKKAQFQCKIGQASVVTSLKKLSKELTPSKTLAVSEETFKAMPCLKM